MTKAQIEYVSVNELIPYANNSRTHSAAQIAQIAASIKEFGWTKPILTDGEYGVIAGHGRLLAARKLGYEEVPTIELKGMTEAQKKAYIIADNKLALNAEWDEEILKVEIEALKEEGFDIDFLGFDNKELEELFDVSETSANAYTQKAEAPTYEPSDLKPNIKDLYDDSKAFEIIEKIKAANIPQAEKDFLMLTAGRHVVLNFQLIADYYAHSSKEIQELMESSALVIVDVDDAIANGWMKLSEELNELYDEDNE
jgi:hypothetical protein